MNTKEKLLELYNKLDEDGKREIMRLAEERLAEIEAKESILNEDVVYQEQKLSI